MRFPLRGAAAIVIWLTGGWAVMMPTIGHAPCAAAEPTEPAERAVSRSRGQNTVAARAGVTVGKFAYEPQAEEGPHPGADFEWWYHFGFLNRQGESQPDYSFVSSFQRSPKGRYLFYTLTELATGRKYHHAIVDRSLFGVADEPDRAAKEENTRNESDERSGGLFAALGRRLARWSLDVLPVLPEAHEFIDAADDCPKPPDTPLWLCYGKNRLQKRESDYRVVFHNEAYQLELNLRNHGHAMPVFGTGLSGIERPEDQHYYSYPRMAARGEVRWLAPGGPFETPANPDDARSSPERPRQRGGVSEKLSGTFWYDHQWGRFTEKALMKWCWWGLQLDDGRNVNMSFLQNSESGKTVQRGLTLQQTNGRTLFTDEVTFTPKHSWTSTNDRRYRLVWEVKAPKLGLTMHIEPIGDDHELPVLLYEYIWEGPCRVVVRGPGDQRTKGIGFQELIGQAHD